MEKKIRKIWQLLALLILILLAHNAQAQNKPVIFERLSTRNGLSQNRVFDIVQDKLGFIWIGTEDGLNRYDGYKFKVFKNIPGDSTSLIRNQIDALHVSKKGELWLGGVRAGLNKFVSENETFVNYSNNHFDPNTLIGNWVIDISEDTTGNLWIATRFNGFDYFDITRNSFYHMANMIPHGYVINNETLTFIHQDRSNHLWVGGPGKLHLFKVLYTKDGIPRLKPVKIENQLVDFSAMSIEEDQGGSIWIGTFNDGLFLFDRTNHVLNPFKIDIPDRQYSNFMIKSIESDNSDNLWLTGFLHEGEIDNTILHGVGVIKIDLQTKTVKNYKNDLENKNSISSNVINVLYKDRTGTLWIGTDLAGINKYDQSVVKFSVFKTDQVNIFGTNTVGIRGFFEENNILWIASASGLLAFDKLSGNYEQFVHDTNNNSTLSSDITRSLFSDDEYLWIGSMNGLNRFNKKTRTFKRFYLEPSTAQSSDPINSVNYNILQLATLPQFLWYGSSGGGLVRFNKNDYTFKNYTYDPENENSFQNRDNFVRIIWYSDSRPNELWTGSTHGINIFNLETESFRYYNHDPKDEKSISHPNVMHFYEDEKGYVWISTYGGGLNRFDPKTEQFLRFTESNSQIPNNAVYGVLPDEQGNLWMSTNNGISKFNPNTFEFRNYTVDDGLQGEEFNGGALYKNSKGEMYFGGIIGFNSFYPADVRDNDVLPEIVITDLKIFNKSIRVGENSPLQKQISNTTEIALSYWQNDISFEFVSLHYANPAKNKYAYMLENYEDEWRYVDDIRSATYTNLDPGKYVFRVKGSNNDGLWNEEGKSLTVIISPPWWRTNIAYLFYLIVLGLVIIAIDRIQRVRLRNQEKRKAQLAILEAENERKTKELEEARELQLSMLPKELPQLAHLDIAVYMQTATEVGGDYYDFHVGLDGTLTVVIGDATGHGMKAGTMVTTAKSLFNSYAPNPDILFSFQEITRCIRQMNFSQTIYVSDYGEDPG